MRRFLKILKGEAERFASAVADEVEERRNEREKQTIARNKKLSFPTRETLEATVKQFEDVMDGYARIEEEYVALDDMWAKFKMEDVRHRVRGVSRLLPWI